MPEERQLLDNNPWWGEHIHRYIEAVKYLGGNNRILDLACGNGYGSYILAENLTNNVVGVDLSKKTIDGCKNHFNRSNLEFITANGTNLSFKENYFDAIVSFETIEHTRQYAEMLNEFNRVLKPKGHLLLSTPNIIVNSPSGKVKNPFHIQEFSFGELSKILINSFQVINIYGQKYERYKNPSIKNNTVKLIEKLFYFRGVRKLPLVLKDKIFRLIIGKPFYPVPEDYSLVSEHSEVLKCKTFFAICIKR